MPSAVHAWVYGTRSVPTTLHTYLSRRNPPTREYILKLTPMGFACDTCQIPKSAFGVDPPYK